jgi:predicted tellurium resistance membrane protein TerC
VDGVDLEAAQRRRARRLGALLALVAAAIVAGTFLWKLSLSQ